MPSTSSVVRSATSTSASSIAARASSSWDVSVTSWPAASSIATTFDPNIRSGTSATTRATSLLLRPQPPERLARRLWPPPHRLHLDAAGAHLAHGQLAGDARLVE